MTFDRSKKSLDRASWLASGCGLIPPIYLLPSTCHFRRLCFSFTSWVLFLFHLPPLVVEGYAQREKQFLGVTTRLLLFFLPYAGADIHSCYNRWPAIRLASQQSSKSEALYNRSLYEFCPPPSHFVFQLGR